MKHVWGTMSGEIDALTGAKRRVGVAVVGAGSISRAHIQALLALQRVVWPPVATTTLEVICGHDLEKTKPAAERWGFRRATADWREAVADPAVGLIVNTGPNDLHAEPSIAAIEAGKHVLCEKPLARSADEARRMWESAADASVVTATSFNYRFVPALAHARELVESGRLGAIHHVRGTYLKGSGVNTGAPFTWRHQRERAGLGALGDLGSHLLDLARWLAGPVAAVTGVTGRFVGERRTGDGGMGSVTVDDASAALLEFSNGALGTIEATRYAPGHVNDLSIEVNGSKGSIRFSLERLNELSVFLEEGDALNAGFRTVLITERQHPHMQHWWPPGHIIGWEHSFVHQMDHVLRAIVEGRQVAPEGATFEDGYRVAVMADAIAQSAASGRRVEIESG